MTEIEDKIALLEEELSNRKKLLMTVINQAQELHDNIDQNYDKRNGLFIRLLTKPLLSHVLSYLGGTLSPAAGVCKYWYHCSGGDLAHITTHTSTHTATAVATTAQSHTLAIDTHTAQNGTSTTHSPEATTGREDEAVSKVQG